MRFKGTYQFIFFAIIMLNLELLADSFDSKNVDSADFMAESSQSLSIQSTQNEQKVTIESILANTKKHYPLSQNKELLEHIKDLELTRLKMRFIPQIRLNGKATYQSDVTKLPFTSQTLSQIAGTNIDYKPLNRDQYNINVEISQPIFDSLNLWANSALVQTQHKKEQAHLESSLYNIKNTVMSAFFGALLLERQIAQNALHIDTLQKHKATISTKVRNGLAHKADVDKISIEILQSQKTQQKLQNEREIALEILFELSHIARDSKLVLPDMNECIKYLESIEAILANNEENKSSKIDFSMRPEMQILKAQQSEIALQKRQEIAKSMPYVDVFIQAGYANPALNILKSGFQGYYIGGIRLNWEFSNLYSNHQQNEIIRLKSLQNSNAMQEFQLNASIELKSNIKKAKKLMQDIMQNENIITTQTNITNSAKVRLENGVMSVNDFLSEINMLNTVKLEQHYDEIELIMQIYQIRQSLNDWK